MMKNTTGFVLTLSALLIGTLSLADEHGVGTAPLSITGTQGTELIGEPLAEFNGAWAMSFLPDGRALVTEKSGTLWLLNVDGSKAGKVGNVPEVQALGQGGLGDIVVHPDFVDNQTIYISYVERHAQNGDINGAVVERTTLVLADDGAELTDRYRLWEQSPKVSGNGHYSHRIAVSPDGYLFITSGERQKFTPAQNMDMNLGKIVRLNQDGTSPDDNPFHGNGEIANQIWTLGHRNLLGIDFDSSGQLWSHEMGPKGGDELNRIVRSENYGYPEVSEGTHYSGEPFASHEDFPIYENPALFWDPVISPSGFVIYDGELFGDWQGDGLIGGLSSQALIRVEFLQAPTDNTGAPPSDENMETIAQEVERYEWGKRIREVEQDSNGVIYVLEDGDAGRLIKLSLASP